MKMELIEGSETSAIRTQTPGNYPKENILYIEHDESLKSRSRYLSTKLRCVLFSVESFCQMHLESQNNVRNKQARLYNTIWQHRTVIINTQCLTLSRFICISRNFGHYVDIWRKFARWKVTNFYTSLLRGGWRYFSLCIPTHKINPNHREF